MPLRARLTAAFLVVVLGPVLLGAVFIGAAVNTVSDGRAVDRLDAAATAVTATVRNHCERLTATASAVALLFSEHSASRAAVTDRAVSAGKVSRVEMADTDGKVLAEAGRRAVAASREALCTGGEQPQQIDSLAAVVDVRDETGRPLGTVTASMAVDTGFVQALAASAGAQVTVDDSRSVPLTSYDGADVSLAEDSLRMADHAKATEPLSANDTGLLVRKVPIMDDSPVPIVVSFGEPSGRGLFAMLVLIVIAAGILAVGAAAWLARSTTRPLAELANGADAVARGELAARVPVRGNDELAALARTFNRMARETQGYVLALTASRDQLRGQLALMGETLSSTLDLDRILEVIVDTAVVATGSRAGVMLLVDPDDPEVLYGRAGEGMAERGVNPSDLRIPIGAGLLGGVAEQGRSRRGRIDTGDAPQLSPLEPSCTTFIAVPVTVTAGRGGDGVEPVPVPGGLLGVLAVYDRAGDDEFDDTDLSTLRTFAGQAAVAVGNVLSHREAQRLSLTDPLTGLWNYRYLQVSLAREVERAGRFHRRAAVIVIDLDLFKVVNDTYGHLAGDAVLAEVARRISAEIRDVDLAFRYGGEEFVVLLPEADSVGAERVAERLSEAVRGQPVVLPPPAGQDEPQSVSVTVSLGLAVFPDNGDDGGEVLAAADEALYAAKAAGRDTWRVAGR